MSEERRLVTVLFADVTGSTALAESLDPEDMRALLARYFAIAREAVEKRGGTLEKFIGDAVMAVFGLPTAHEDDAARAARAALDLRDQVRADAVLGERLPIRLGLATGEVVAAMEGSAADFLITGDAVNVAARLQQGAASWEIIVSDRTVRAAGTGFSFGPLAEVEARGKGARVPARLLHGVAAGRPRVRTPFLGRDADVAQLDLTADRVLREQRPYLVTITAPAGTGKSRLLEEFLERQPMLRADGRVLIAQCLPWGQRLTYHPLHVLLLTLLELPANAEPDAMRAAAETWLTAIGDPAPRRTAELLAATFGASEGDPIDRAELFAAWRSTIELAARERPLVMVVEDLHWSSDSLLDLIELVLQPRGAAPMLMIVLARPELLDRRPTWAGGRRNSVSIALEPLDDLAISALVDFHLAGPPPEIAAAVVARAGGNPFFAGELARTIAERAPDLADPAAVAAVMATLPDNVHGAVLARLDLLPPVARRVVQLGAVFGRSFRQAGIEVLAPDLADVDGAVDHLVEHDLIRAGGTDEFTFRHILIRDVGYQTLPRAERARLHGAAGAWLEAQAVDREDEQAELVAFHFREAIALSIAAGLEPHPTLTVSAVNWLRRAARAATAGAAFSEAARHLRAAIDLAPPDVLPELWADLGDANTSGTPAIEAYATAARLGAEQGRSADFMLRALGNQLMVLGRWAGSVASDDGRVELQALLELVREVRANATDKRLIGLSLVAESFTSWVTPAGSLVDDEAERGTAAAVATQAVAIARELDDAALLSMALDAAGAVELGVDPERGLALAEERASLEQRLPLAERVDLHNMLAWNHSALGNLDQVVPAVEAVLHDLVPNQATAIALSLAGWQTWGLAMTGRWDEVSAAMDGFARTWEESGRSSAGYSLQGGTAALEVGWARADDRLVARATAVIQGITEQFPKGNIFRRLGAFTLPDTEAIAREVIGDWVPYGTRLHLVERCLSLCVDLGQAIPDADLDALLENADTHGQRLLAAQVRRARGVQAGSATDLRTALDAFTTFRAPAMVARLQIELGRLSGDGGLEASGLAGLEALGDQAAIGRFATAAARR